MRRMLLAVLTLLLLTVPVCAIDHAEFGLDTAPLQDGLTEEQQELMGDASPTDWIDFADSVQALISRAVRNSGGFLREAAAQAAVLLAICLVSGLAGTAGTDGIQVNVIAGVLAITAAATHSLGGMIRLGTDTVQELVAFSQLLLPVLTAASTASGAFTSASAVCGITVLFTELLLSLTVQLLVPGIYIYLALTAADCVLQNSALSRICALIAWLQKCGLKWIMYGFTGFLTVTQVISGTADALTTRAAKLTLSGAVPVVGSIISDASETVLVSAAMLRNSVGIYGMLAVLSVCILPFLRIGLCYLTLKATAAVSGIVAEGKLIRMVDALSTAMGLLLAMTGTAAFMMLISVVCMLKMVGL